MLASIRYNLTNLTNFNGRDGRQTFWLYVLFLVVVYYVLGMASGIPMMAAIFDATFTAVQDGVQPEAIHASMAGEMAGYFRFQMIIGLVLGVAFSALGIAAFVRRLHDAGYSGWIALAPLFFHAISLWASIRHIDRIEELFIDIMEQARPQSQDVPDIFAMQAEIGLLGMVGWIGLIIVMVFGALKSTDGPNKYGDAPVRL